MGKTHAFRPEDTEQKIGTGYPEPFQPVAAGRMKHALGDHAGLDQYGVNLTILPPGQASALRHWHKLEDEFVYIVSGELTLITDDGEEVMTPGMCAGFKAGVENGHHLVNRSAAPASFLEIGSRLPDEEGFYPDDDLHLTMTGRAFSFTNKKGEAY